MIRNLITASLLGTFLVIASAGWLVFLAYSVPAIGGERICGDASFYAEAHHGKIMANGKPFNMNALTAAMWGPKFGTRYRVTYHGKSVDVTITDRGPAKRLNRVIDLSKAAFARLAPLPRGVLKNVCLDRL